jgi:hypothetical protein
VTRHAARINQRRRCATLCQQRVKTTCDSGCG